MISSKFGELEITSDNQVFFPQGLIGMPEYKNFCISDIQDKRFALFKAMHCLDKEGYTFLILPITEKNNFLTEKDKKEVTDFLAIKLENLKLFVIASTKMIDGSKRIAVNLRAPIFVDDSKNQGYQYVMQNNAYNIQFPL